MVEVKIKMINPQNGKKMCELNLVADTGSIYSVVSVEELSKIGITPRYEREFKTIDGKKIRRKVGIAIFKYKEYEGGAPVIFGEKEDMNVLGVTALEAMGLEVDPVNKELKPVELLLL